MSAGRTLAGAGKLPDAADNTGGSVAECASSPKHMRLAVGRFGAAPDEVPVVPILFRSCAACALLDSPAMAHIPSRSDCCSRLLQAPLSRSIRAVQARPTHCMHFGAHFRTPRQTCDFSTAMQPMCGQWQHGRKKPPTRRKTPLLPSDAHTNGGNQAHRHTSHARRARALADPRTALAPPSGSAGCRELTVAALRPPAHPHHHGAVE